MFSSRTSWDHSENPLTEALKKLHAKNQPILDLTESNPTQCGFQYDTKKILSSLSNTQHFDYKPDPCGLKMARLAIAEQYYKTRNIKVSEDQIVITSSTSEAYSFLFKLLTNPHDGVLAPSPSYPLIEHLAALNDTQVFPYALNENQNWSLDFESIEKNLKPHVKAIIAIHPNNPTGSFVKKLEKERLNTLCQKHRCALIVDEVFLDYAFDFDATRVKSFAENAETLTFTLSGLSKVLGLPQMKLSWIVVNGPEKERKEALKRLEFIADTYLSVNTVTQQALPAWFEAQFEIQNQIRERIQQNYKFAKKSLKAPLQALSTEGGWYIILRFQEPINDEEIALKLLNEHYVLVHPGFFYDLKESHWVLSLLCPIQDFEMGLEKIKKLLSSHPASDLPQDARFSR